MSIKNRVYDVINSTKIGRAALEVRRAKRANAAQERVAQASYEFVDRSKGSEKLCIVLAGYKEPLWGEVFGRLKAFAPADLDVCIMTSGLENDTLKKIAEENNWSYLSTSVNHLSLVQNIAIDVHPQAKWVYKIDEDMFLTKGFFEKLLETYDYVDSETCYRPAFVSPLINVSCYGHIRLLEKCGLTEEFRATGLTDMKVTDGLHHNKQVLENVAASRYLWGETQPMLRDIDALTEEFSKGDLAFSICPVRYSIGAILFTRDSWEEFGKFPLTFVGSEFGLGDDEEHICHYACFTGRAMVICENVVVGHLGYGPQTSEMMKYYEAHKDWFALSR